MGRTVRLIPATLLVVSLAVVLAWLGLLAVTPAEAVTLRRVQAVGLVVTIAVSALNLMLTLMTPRTPRR